VIKTPRLKDKYRTRKEMERRAVYGRRSNAYHYLRVPFLKSQINRYQPRKVRNWCNDTLHPDVLDAPDNKVNPRPRCRTRVAAKRGKPTCVLRSQMRNSARVFVLALSLVLHAWPHDTEPYHSSGKSGCCTKTRKSCDKAVIAYCLLRFHAVRHNTIPLRW